MMKLEERWARLLPAPDGDVFQLVDPEHPLAFYLGRDSHGGLSLLLVTEELPPPAKEFRTISIQTFERPDGKWSLLFRLTSMDLEQMFLLFCNDLINASRQLPDPKKPIVPLMRRFANWQRLLARGLNGLLDEQSIRGLCGELLVMEKMLFPVFGLRVALTSWTGPDQASQDFQMAGQAWEVKTARPGTEKVTISSEWQLDTTARPVDLVVVTLSDAMASAITAFTLNELVTRLRETFAQDLSVADLFELKLAAYGYMTRTEYDEKFYSMTIMRVFEISEGFPSLTPSQLPDGVSGVSYNLDLTRCKSFLENDLK